MLMTQLLPSTCFLPSTLSGGSFSQAPVRNGIQQYQILAPMLLDAETLCRRALLFYHFLALSSYGNLPLPSPPRSHTLTRRTCLLICSQPTAPVENPQLSPIRFSATTVRFVNSLETPSPLFVAGGSLTESNRKGAHRRRTHHHHRADQGICCRRLRERCVEDNSRKVPCCYPRQYCFHR